MPRQLIECVPNFSEGRDAAKVDAILKAILSVPGVALLGREMDADHNRSVITFAGPPDAVAGAAFRAVEKAVALIDLNLHTGVHPRIGAADVVPFIPIEGVSVEECIKLAERVAEEVWRKLHVPVYFYEAAARRQERTNLENIRRGQFEALLREMGTLAAREPDCGEARCHPTAGATVIGVRKLLIAYNINLGTADVEIARKIASTIRFSSGGLPCVKAMGVPLASRNLSQVSMNLTDFEQTPVHRVFDAVCAEAERYGVPVVGSEIVGLIPKKAIEMAAGHFLRAENFAPGLVLENRIAETMASRPPLSDFLDALAAPAATCGGGNASAAAAAMAAALGAKVMKLSGQDATAFEQDRAIFSAAVDRPPAVEADLDGAIRVSLEVAERTRAMLDRLAALDVPDRLESELAAARSLGTAARDGAAANVRLNLDSIRDPAFRQEAARRLSSAML